jgi:hypothetical protein
VNEDSLSINRAIDQNCELQSILAEGGASRVEFFYLRSSVTHIPRVTNVTDLTLATMFALSSNPALQVRSTVTVLRKQY